MENESLLLDLVEWLAEQPRPYDEVMGTWRTTCPRLTVWEDTVDAGFVEVRSGESEVMVHATARGLEFLAVHGRHPGETHRERVTPDDRAAT